MSDNTGIYVVLAFYVVATSVVTFCANKNNREEAGTTGDEVTTHFLAGKNFASYLSNLLVNVVHSALNDYWRWR